MSTQVATAPTAPEPQVVAMTRPARRGLDRFELAVLVVFACLSLWVLALDLWQVAVHGRVWTGTDGLFLADQMQYLAWIQDAARHALVSDMFVLHPSTHDYFQPIVMISAGITKLGVAPWLALLLWKPVAVAAAFIAIRAYTRRTLTDRFDQRAALLLALFFGSWGVLGDEWIPFASWGYPFQLLAIAALAAALLAYDRSRREGRIWWAAPVLGLMASLVHPWQGEVLILTVIGAEAFRWDRPKDLRRWLGLPVLTIVAAALPLLYYELLYRLDPHWRAAQAASKHIYSLSGILVPLIPLLIASALAYRRRPDSFISAATRAWPLAALAIFGFSQTGLAGTPLHAFNGITVPLAVLSVEGVRQLGLRRLPRWRVLAAVLVVAATIPATVAMLYQAHHYVKPRPYHSNFIRHDEKRALDYLSADQQPGGVLARATYLGLIVPAKTGRHTYAGTCLWSEPHCGARIVDTRALFVGRYGPGEARAFVRSTGARFLLKDCNSHADLSRLLGSLVTSERRFGCAAVYQVRQA
jgi:hypothetical protein